MNILLLGGTRFLGKAIAEAFVANGDNVTLLHRGKSTTLPEGVTSVIGDRHDVHTFDSLQEEWDMVIDTCGYHPDAVRTSVNALQKASKQYLFISTISVYEEFAIANNLEEDDAALLTISDAQMEQEGLSNDKFGKFYGHLKTRCEEVVREGFPNNHLILRPGLLVGPYDVTDRFTYWAWRVQQEAEMLAPGRPDKQAQFIDVRDIADWLVRLSRNDVKAVTMNVIGPTEGITMEQLIEKAKQATGSSTPVTWVEETFLKEQGVQPWMEMPLWLPESFSLREDGRLPEGEIVFSLDRAIEYGLQTRPVEDTIRDLVTWWDTLGKSEPGAGIALSKETLVLQEWHAKQEATEQPS